MLLCENILLTAHSASLLRLFLYRLKVCFGVLLKGHANTLAQDIRFLSAISHSQTHHAQIGHRPMVGVALNVRIGITFSEALVFYQCELA